MSDHNFRIVIRAGAGEGVSLRTVVDKLSALEKIYEATTSATLRPGAGRIAIPDSVREVASLRLTEASPTASLSVAVSEPIVPPAYQGDYRDLPPTLNSAFRNAVHAAANRDQAKIIQLFPEKADQLRVLNGFQQLAPADDEEPVLIEGLNSDRLVFRQEHREWAEKSRPSLTPEKSSFIGMVRNGSLSENAQFKLYDGVRTVQLHPESNGVIKLRDLFGRVVKVSGVAHFDANGAVRRLADITQIEPFKYQPEQIAEGERRFYLAHRLSFDVAAALDGRGFTLTNDEVGITAFGRSLTQAIEAVAIDFSVLWDEIGLAEPEELHNSALGLRDFLRRTVNRVEEDNVI